MKNVISNEERIKRLKLNCSLHADGKIKYFHQGKEYVDLGAFESEEAFRQEGEERMEELKEYILTSKVQDFLAENADRGNKDK